MAQNLMYLYRERGFLSLVHIDLVILSPIGIKCVILLLIYSVLVLGCMVHSLSLALRVFGQGIWHSYN